MVQYMLAYVCICNTNKLNCCPLTEAGAFVHEVEGEMLCKLTNKDIPYFNAGIFLENKTKVGKIEEILGPINEVSVSKHHRLSKAHLTYTSGPGVDLVLLVCGHRCTSQ
jgi:hypothetical protein